LAESSTILVVDDDDVVMKTFERVLTVGGFHVVTAHSAREALAHLDAERPDAVILDVWMPLVNGLGFLYRLRALETHQHLPVLVVTGGSLTHEMLAELATLGATVRHKPIPATELLAATRRMVRGTETGSDN
jgi:DNA-binding response OmpR family regulator